MLTFTEHIDTKVKHSQFGTKTYLRPCKIRSSDLVIYFSTLVRGR